MAFVKGQSGNPSGRPRNLLPDGRSLTDLCREHTPEAVRALVEIVGDSDAPPAARVSAADSILNRGWGRAPQAVLVVPNDRDGNTDTAMPGGLFDALAWLAAARGEAPDTSH